MNTINFNQAGGFPLTTNVLQQQQDNFSTLINALGNIAGNLGIISGCDIISVSGPNTNVSAGVVYINGEVLEFQAGIAKPTVIIVEEVTKLVFADDKSKDTIKKRYVKFGTGSGAINWADFKRPLATRQIPNDINSRLAVIEQKLSVFGVGAVVLWYTFNPIPPGWQEVTALSGRMPVGRDGSDEFHEIGQGGGDRIKTLGMHEIPPHSFTYKKIIPRDWADVLGYDGVGDEQGASYVDEQTNTLGGGNHFSLLNPYRVVIFIQYVGAPIEL